MAPNTRVRHDKINKCGVFTLRHGTKLHHVGVGRGHRGRRDIILVADLDIRVLSEEVNCSATSHSTPRRTISPSRRTREAGSRNHVM
jgi:hypothetical protein